MGSVCAYSRREGQNLISLGGSWAALWTWCLYASVFVPWLLPAYSYKKSFSWLLVYSLDIDKVSCGTNPTALHKFFFGTNQFFYDKVGLIHVVYTNRLRFLVGSTQIRIIFPPSMYTNRILFPPSTKLSNFELMLGQTILRMNLESFVFVDGCR